ncbi:LytR/AlgR family response regulator transcription factor [Psychroflexus planctonicus]|uniref:DNA-binding response regulator n=1 Tax=Psychroflexus planctonicus TaxID=1526575 RepID=A0ABQ1SDR0_9FLAO|nr:LytTR family DNA-binding domain-containing protein [Psychroflexus planctonicus]GGE31006.1 DNA-binding response regulator [Psychroflexus planctonicus]
MEKLSCVIVEDEKPAARRLARLLVDNSLDCKTQLHDVKSAVSWFQHNPAPDLIFLDIQLSDGLSFEIFEEVAISCPIIFTTAYDEYALRAFKLNSIDYLLKPIDKEELSFAIRKFRQQKLSNKIDLNKLQDFLNNQVNSRAYKERFSVVVGRNLKSITTDEIALFYSSNKASYVLHAEGRSYVVDYSLDQLEAYLNPKEFFRISRKFIVKHSAIKQIISYSNSRLKVELFTAFDELLIVSRERVKDFKVWLG